MIEILSKEEFSFNLTCKIKYAHVKLGLVYECNPLAFVIEQSSGKATTGFVSRPYSGQLKSKGFRF